jgi:alkanesulfonate monooxygenase SsuD/methylene tetrahydromethanopterin reductase-like flavin-dependent oxidoreductase (luciferase family)
VKVGILLPSFADTAAPALAAAARAEAVGLDGVFAYDHLWPMGEPTKPALAPFPLLALIGQRHQSLWVGPLVARIGVVSTDVLLEEFAALTLVAPGRVVAALGTGDKLSETENDAYGVPRRSADERRALVREAAEALTSRAEVWIGAGAPATNDLAVQLGVTLNLWRADVGALTEAAARGRVSWAGRADGDLPTHLNALASAGATWAVFSSDVDLAALGEWRHW